MRESFRDLPRSCQVFILILVSTFLAAGILALPHNHIVVVAGLTAIFATASLVRPIPNPSGGQIYPSNSVKIVAALLWSPEDVLLGVGIGSCLGLLLLRKYEIWRATMNGAGWGLPTAAATFAAHMAFRGAEPGVEQLAVAAIFAVVTNRVINEGIFSIYRSTRFGHPYLVTWLQNILDQWPSQFLAASMAIVLATFAVRADTLGVLLLTSVAVLALPIPRLELAYYHRFTQMLGEIVESIVRALEGVDPRARAHGERVSMLAVEVGRRLGMSEQARRAIALASRLHDVGILAGPDGPTPQGHHAAVGGRILAEFPDPMIARIVRAHHERWDGKGVPDGKSGKAIPLGARILAAAEIYDSALEGLSPFEAPLSRETAAGYLTSLAGTVLDPRVVTTLLRTADEQRAELGAAG